MKEKDTSIRELFHQPPTETLTDVSVSGWVRTVRDSKAFGFIELNDGTYFKNLQIVLEDGKTADFANALKVTLGSAIRAKAWRIYWSWGGLDDIRWGRIGQQIH